MLYVRILVVAPFFQRLDLGVLPTLFAACSCGPVMFFRLSLLYIHGLSHLCRSVMGVLFSCCFGRRGVTFSDLDVVELLIANRHTHTHAARYMFVCM